MLQRWRLSASQRRLFCKAVALQKLQLAAGIWTAHTARQRNVTPKALVHD